ncbi:type 1 pili tip component [Acidihalobacter prosperus]
MSEIHKILERWSRESHQQTQRCLTELSLSPLTVAQLRALEEMYPGHTLGYIADDLLHTALAELEKALPYKPGTHVLREDEFGDPVYEDVGPTPRFLELVKYHLNNLETEMSTHSSGVTASPEPPRS